MDKDNWLDEYIDKLLREDIDQKEFEDHIQLLSKYIAQTNPDYKYNGTYLSTYMEELREIRAALLEKHGKYTLIFENLCKLHQDFDVEMDNTYGGSCRKEKKTPKYRGNYIGINRDKIKSDKVEINIRFLRDDKVFLFFKKYDYTNKSLRSDIIGDVKTFIKEKGLEEGKK